MVLRAMVSKLKYASKLLGRAFKMQMLKKQGYLEMWSRSLYFKVS